MAGFYPDVPAPRMSYDRDGSILVRIDGSSVTVLADSVKRDLNDQSDTQYGFGTGSTYQMGLIFPQLRDVTGIYIVHYAGAAFSQGLDTFEISSDTTNGLDGTWSSPGDPTEIHGSVGTTARTSIQSVSWLGIKAFRFYARKGDDATPVTHYMRAIHLYGAIAAGENPDRLRIWHPTLDEPLDDANSADGAYFDWGDIQRNTTSDKTFRIKNNSASLTANGVVISQETLTETSPTVNSQFTFSDGGTFAASIDIGNLAPGALSPVITKRYARPSNATLSLWTSRTIANPTSWS